MPKIGYDATTVPVSPAETPADAQGANFSPAVGQSLEQIAGQGERLTSDFARIQYQRQQADQITALNQNFQYVRRAVDGQDGGQTSARVAVTGAGYTDLFKQEFDPYAQQLLDQQTDPRVKRIAAEHLAAMHNRFYNQASAWEVNTNRAWRVNTFDDGITQAAAQVQQDPTQYQSALDAQKNMIDALSGQLHPEDKIALTQKAEKSLAEGCVHRLPQYNLSIRVQPSCRGY